MTQGQAVCVRVGVSGISNHLGGKAKVPCKVVREAASIGPYAGCQDPKKLGRLGYETNCTEALQHSVAVPWGTLSWRKLSQQGEHLLKNHQQH